MSELSDRDRAILEFEAKWTRHEGLKEQRIRDAFGLSAARYYQVLNRILNDPAAVELMPHDVHRLQRLREARVTSRAARRL